MRKTLLSFVVPPAWPQRLAIVDEDVRVIGRWHFLVRSKSEDGWHCVDLEPVDEWPDGGCTCRGYTTRKDCRHIRAIREYLGLA